MNSLTTQLDVLPEDALVLAEQLVGGQFDCPLGGDYELVPVPDAQPFNREAQPFSRNAQPFSRDPKGSGENGSEHELIPLPVAGEGQGEGARQLWTSTATPPANRFLLTEIPADYEMPLMNWFRGLDVEVLRAEDALTLHAELDMTHLDVGPPADEGDEGGGFFGNLLGWGKSEEEKQPSQPVSEGDTLPELPEK
jgi:hypothetical protein